MNDKIERLKETKELLIVVDMVNGFLKEGALADPKMERITSEVVRLVKLYLNKQNKMVAFIKDSHHENSLEFKKFPIHCLEGTSESELIDELKPFESDALSYKKNSRSAIFAKGFMNDIIQMENLTKIIITGVCLDLCDLDLSLPLMNYFDQIDKDVEIVIPLNAVDTYDSDFHDREEYIDTACKILKQEGIKIERSL